MDRLAYQNMTLKGRNQLTDNSQMINSEFTNEWPGYQQDRTYYENNNNRDGASLDSFSQPTGALTSKSKMNTQLNHYHLERQSKNLGQYNSFVSALNSNISEDQQRTNINNDRLKTEQKEIDNFNRVYHPGLLTQTPDQGDSLQYDRSSLGTRDRRENGLAKNKNTTQASLPQPAPKLNYPQGYDQLSPMNMDMTSHLEMQFRTLTDIDMDNQITNLQSQGSKISKQNAPTSQNQSVSDRQFFLQPQSQSAYNPRADYLNNQLQQMSQQMPDNKNSVENQLQSMNSMYGLNSLPDLPSVDPIGFQRPTSSNYRGQLPVTGGQCNQILQSQQLPNQQLSNQQQLLNPQQLSNQQYLSNQQQMFNQQNLPNQQYLSNQQQMFNQQKM